MTQRCFVKRGKGPPVCGVHNVPLVEHQTAKEAIPGWVGNITFLKCPLSDQVPENPEDQSNSTP